MKRLVITGATSFIGKAIIRAADEFDIKAVVRRNSDKAVELRKMPNVEVIERNMDEYATLGSAVGAADCYIHLAWKGTRGEDRMDEALQRENYVYGMQAIESMLAAGCKRVITAGSQAEYGNVTGLITEEVPCNPNTSYGNYKLRLYETVSQLCEEKGVSHKEPRIFSIYGPGDYKNTLIMSLIAKLSRNESCDLTAGTQKWDYLHVDDAAAAILTLATAECPDGAYNLASGDVRTLRDYIEELYEILQSDSKLNFGAIPYPPTGAVSIEPCIQKIQSLTGWKAKVCFRDGINRMIACQSLL